MSANRWNLLAATLCTIGAGCCAAGFFVSEPSDANLLAGIGTAIGAAGGGAWIVAAVIAVTSGPMKNHDYLVLATAVVWLVTNWLGAAFTIRRIRRAHSKLNQQEREGSIADRHGIGLPAFSFFLREFTTLLRLVTAFFHK